jgi:hypothetical protein
MQAPWKIEANLMNRTYAMNRAPRCSATSKRTKKPCQAPAVKGRPVCRFHGARAGAPSGRANGSYKHGHFSNEAVQQRRAVARLRREAQALIARL